MMGKAALKTVIDEKGKLDNTKMFELGTYLMTLLFSEVTYEEEDALIKEEVAEIYSGKYEYSEAAKLLERTNIDSRKLTDEEKFVKYVKIAEQYIEDEDGVNAERMLNKAAQYDESVPAHSQDNLRRKVVHGKVLDGQRRFDQASSTQFQLANSGPEVDESDKFTLLGLSTICAILSPAGPKRQKMLAALYKDERTQNLDTYNMLSKTFFGQVIKKEEAEKFKEKLQPHHMATMSDGTTVQEKSIIEHNMLAISNLYHNISIEELSRIIQSTPEKTEKIAGKMIYEKRMEAILDQESQLILFSSGEEYVVKEWDNEISEMCRQLGTIVDLLNVKK